MEELSTLRSTQEINLRAIGCLQKEKSSLDDQVCGLRKNVDALKARIDDLEDKDGNTSIELERKQAEAKVAKDKFSNFKSKCLLGIGLNFVSRKSKK